MCHDHDQKALRFVFVSYTFILMMIIHVVKFLTFSSVSSIRILEAGNKLS
jgi:hypothetical protein